MTETKSLRPILEEHPLFRGLKSEYLDLLTDCAANVRFDQDAYLFHAGDEANDFFLIRHGMVAVEAEDIKGPIVVETLGPGDILGWSWVIPPYNRKFATRAVQLTRAISVDALCLRQKCEADPKFGYKMIELFSKNIKERLYNAWWQMADIYGPPAR